MATANIIIEAETRIYVLEILFELSVNINYAFRSKSPDLPPDLDSK